MQTLISRTDLNKKTFTVYPGKGLERFVLEPFWFEVINADISQVDEAVLTAPFILNIAPVVWLSGLKFSIKTMDAQLYSSLSQLREWFKCQYPEITWQGEIIPDQLDHHVASPKAAKPALLFSGGLDSVASLHRHILQKPVLITVQGADVRLTDMVSWKGLSTLTASYAQEHKLVHVQVRSNVLDFLNQHRLGRAIGRELSWWNNIQHGMSLMGLVIPICHIYSCSDILMASSVWSEDGESAPIRWGSSSGIAECIHFRGLTVREDFQVSRQEKLEFLKTLEEKNHIQLKLRVCFKVRKGLNCGKCEKCLRTILGMLIAGISRLPEYGFPEGAEVYTSRLKAIFATGHVVMDPNHLLVWKNMQRRVAQEAYYRGLGYDNDLLDPIHWIKTFDLDQYHSQQRPAGKKADLRRSLALWSPWIYKIIRKLQRQHAQT